MLARVCVLDQILGVDLVLLEHHEYGGVVDVVHTAVVEHGVSSVFGRGPQITGLSFSVVAHQDPAHEHGARARVFGVAVRVLRIPGKITPCEQMKILRVRVRGPRVTGARNSGFIRGVRDSRTCRT